MGLGVLAKGSEYQADSMASHVGRTKGLPAWEAPSYPINSFLWLSEVEMRNNKSDSVMIAGSDLRLLKEAIKADLSDASAWSLEQRWHRQMLSGHVSRYEHDYVNALTFYHNALEISRNIKDERYKINALYACYEMEEANESLVLALEYFKEYARIVHRMQDLYMEEVKNTVKESEEQIAYGDNPAQKSIVLGVILMLIILAVFYLPGTFGYHISINRVSSGGSVMALDDEASKNMFVNIYKPGIAATEEQIDEEILVDEEKIEMLIRLREIKLITKDDWEQFQFFFDRVHAGYLVKLRLKHFGLTPSEEKLCCLIRLHLATREIAKTFGISNHSVNVARYRLRKKVLPAGNLTLEEYLMTI
jgi:tetratricopeptide (TPR) repeat protein